MAKRRPRTPPKMEDLPEVMTRAQVGEYLQVTERTIDRWIAEEGMPTMKLGGTGRSGALRIGKSDLLTWMSSRKG